MILGGILTLIYAISHVTSVLGEACAYHIGSGTYVVKDCEHGCCDTDCCREPFWNWYVIIGLVVAGIFVLIFIVGVIVLLYIHCIKAKETPRSRNLRSARRVDPVWNTTFHPSPHFNPTQPPPYSEYEPPPKYEASQLPPQVRSSILPQPQTSTGVPTRTASTLRHT